MFKRLLAGLTAVTILLCCSGCGKEESVPLDGSGDWEQIIDTGVLRVGVLESATCTTAESGFKSGFEPVLIARLCEELSLRLEYVDVTPGSEEDLLNNNRVDCIWGMTYAPALEETFDCSIPYLLDDQVAVYSGSNGSNLDTVDAVMSTDEIAVLSGSPAQSTANRLKLNHVVCTSETEVFNRVISGSNPAALVSYAAALPFLNDPDYAALVVGPVVESYEKVVVYRKDSYLNDRIRRTLKKFNENGTIDRIADEYKLFGQVPGNHTGSVS